ncbi:hypothetical protein BC962_3066 [Gillisia mitskevichiae]|uniref:Uncharacterized protein n=1 Tax=Gillisia mitskevichiae TaxID=270921 RepID=A0A495P281_9FLAO|nr:hypothetical protein BC962_3066 [Gillisia mitskevichiae]
MKINRTGFILLNIILFAAIIVGYYELVEIKELVSIFVIPAFIISASLQYGQKDRKKKA